MELNDLFDYKNHLMRQLCCDENIVKLVTGSEDAEVPNHGLPYERIFPYEYVPDTVGEASTFICFDVDIVSVQSRTFYTPAIYVWVFTHKSRMRTDDGRILIDQISVEVNRLLNGSREYGLGELELVSARRFTPIDDYKGRVLVYSTSEFNRKSGSKPWPSSRKQ